MRSIERLYEKGHGPNTPWSAGLILGDSTLAIKRIAVPAKTNQWAQRMRQKRLKAFFHTAEMMTTRVVCLQQNPRDDLEDEGQGEGLAASG